MRQPFTTMLYAITPSNGEFCIGCNTQESIDSAIQLNELFHPLSTYRLEPFPF